MERDLRPAKTILPHYGDSKRRANEPARTISHPARSAVLAHVLAESAPNDVPSARTTPSGKRSNCRSRGRPRSAGCWTPSRHPIRCWPGRCEIRDRAATAVHLVLRLRGGPVFRVARRRCRTRWPAAPKRCTSWGPWPAGDGSRRRGWAGVPSIDLVEMEAAWSPPSSSTVTTSRGASRGAQSTSSSPVSARPAASTSSRSPPPSHPGPTRRDSAEAGPADDPSPGAASVAPGPVPAVPLARLLRRGLRRRAGRRAGRRVAPAVRVVRGQRRAARGSRRRLPLPGRAGRAAGGRPSTPPRRQHNGNLPSSQISAVSRELDRSVQHLSGLRPGVVTIVGGNAAISSDDGSSHVQLVARTNATDHIVKESSSSGPGIWLPSDVASQLKVGVGDQVELTTSGAGQPVPMTVRGTFRDLANSHRDPTWCSMQLTFEGFGAFQPNPVALVDAPTLTSTLQAGGVNGIRVTWEYPPDARWLVAAPGRAQPRRPEGPRVGGGQRIHDHRPGAQRRDGRGRPAVVARPRQAGGGDRQRVHRAGRARCGRRGPADADDGRSHLARSSVA